MDIAGLEMKSCASGAESIYSFTDLIRAESSQWMLVR